MRGRSGTDDRTQTPAVPIGAEAGPAVPPDAEWDGYGIPPEGTVLSTPVEGELIAGNRVQGGYVVRNAQGDRLGIEFRPLFPDGHWLPAFKG